MGGSKAKKRRSVCSSLTSVKSKLARSIPNNEAESTQETAGAPQHPIDDVDPGEDDDFVKKLVNVQQTQQCLNSRQAFRTSTRCTKAATAVDGNSGHKIFELTVQVPSMEYLFEKYGKYIIVGDNAVTNNSVPTVCQTEIKCEPIDPHEDISPNTVQSPVKSQILKPICKTEPPETISKNQPSVLLPNDIQPTNSNTNSDALISKSNTNTNSAKPKKKKKKSSSRKRSRKKNPTPLAASGLDPSPSAASGLDPHPLAASGLDPTPSAASGLDVIPDKSSSSQEVPSVEPLEKTPSVPALPKRVTLKKNLIHDMISRLNKGKSSSTTEKDVSVVVSVTEEVPNASPCPDTLPVPLVTIDAEEQLTEQFVAEKLTYQDDHLDTKVSISQAKLIVKEEVDVEDGLVIPRIEAISGASLSPPRIKHQGRSPLSSEDEHDEDDDLADPDFEPEPDDVDADPDFDPDDERTIGFYPTGQVTKKSHAAPKVASTPKSTTTCETCSLRFLSVVNFKIHMKEYHNEYSSEDEEESAPTPVPAESPSIQFNCELCQLPFGTAVGLKIHTRQKHKEPTTNVRKVNDVVLDHEPKETVTEPVQQQPIVAKVLYVCSFPNCDLQFSSIQNMKIHKCLQHEYKPKQLISCILCTAATAQPSAFLRHLKTSHPGKVDEEGYGEFTRLGYSEQTKGKPIPSRSESGGAVSGSAISAEAYKCSECNISYKWQATLDAHLKAFHNKNVAGGDPGTQRKSGTNRPLPDLSPILAATLLNQSTPARTSSEIQVPISEVIPEAEIISLSDSEEEKDEDLAITAKAPLPVPEKKTPTEKESTGKSPAVVTVCPYCFKSVLFNDFPAHVEVHANKAAGKSTKKLSCPYSGCKQSFNVLEELISHHKISHQEKITSQNKDKEPPKPPPAITSSSPSSLPSKNPSQGFKCKFCENVHFPDMAGLLNHCQLLHKKNVEAEENHNLRKRNVVPMPPLIANPIYQNNAAKLPSLIAVTPVATIGPSGSTYALTPIERDPLDVTNLGSADVLNPNSSDQSAGAGIRVTPLPIISSRTSTYDPPPLQQAGILNLQSHFTAAGNGEGSEQNGIDVTPLMSPLLECFVCGVDGFISQQELDMHIMTHQADQAGAQDSQTQPRLDQFICELCTMSFPTLEDRNEHSMAFHKVLSVNLPGRCPICKIVIKHVRNIPRHIHTAHKMRQCHFCPQLFKQEEQYQMHITLHTSVSAGVTGKPRYQCLECLQIFDATSRISHHYNMLHVKGDKCTCVTCNIQLQRTNLQRHLELHRRESREIIPKLKQHQFKPRSYNAGGDTSPVATSEQTLLRQDLVSYTSSDQILGTVGDVEEILSDPLAEPGDESEPLHIFHPSYQQTQFEFEDVTIGEEGGNYEDNNQDTTEMVGEFHTMDISRTTLAATTTPAFNYSEILDGDGEGDSNSMSSTEFEDTCGDGSSLDAALVASRLGKLATAEAPLDDQQRLLLCGFCPKRFRRRDNRENHIKRVHKNPTSRECAFCGEYYKNDMALVRHINVNHANQRPKPEYQPPVVRSQPSGRGRRRSVSSVQAPRPRLHQSVSDLTQCQFCGLTFRGVMDRRKHELIHFPMKTTDEDAWLNDESSTCSVPGQEKEDTIFGSSEENLGVTESENVFMPLELTVRTTRESTPYVPYVPCILHLEADSEEIGEGSPEMVPQSFDEFIALL